MTRACQRPLPCLQPFAVPAEVQGPMNVLGGTVEKAVPADEVTVGFAALLRQLFRHNEEASFDVIRNVLARAAYESDAAEVTRILRQWKDAHTRCTSLTFTPCSTGWRELVDSTLHLMKPGACVRLSPNKSRPKT
jgi:hypothetical protein